MARARPFSAAVIPVWTYRGSVIYRRGHQLMGGSRSALGRRLRLVLLLVVPTAGCRVGHGSDRDVVFLGDTIVGECATCRIQFETLWTSDSSDPNVILSPATSVLSLDDSVLIAYSDGQVVLFGPDGRTARVIGRRGDGPGEFRALLDALQLQDGFVLVVGTNRLTFLDERLAFVDARRPPVRPLGPGIVPIGDSAVVVAGRLGNQFSGPLQHVLSLRGELLGSYDAVSGFVASTNLSPGTRGTVWLMLGPIPGKRPEYRLEQWDPASGRRLRLVKRRPPWFREFKRGATWGRRLSEETPGNWPPTVYDAFQSSDHVLWTLTVLQEPDYDVTARPGVHPSFMDRIDVILEAIDPESGRLIVGRRFDAFLPGFTPTGDLVVYEEDSIGRPTLSIRSPSLVDGRESAVR